jgi:hypothetical protein
MWTGFRWGESTWKSDKNTPYRALTSTVITMRKEKKLGTWNLTGTVGRREENNKKKSRKDESDIWKYVRGLLSSVENSSIRNVSFLHTTSRLSLFQNCLYIYIFCPRVSWICLYMLQKYLHTLHAYPPYLIPHSEFIILTFAWVSLLSVCFPVWNVGYRLIIRSPAFYLCYLVSVAVCPPFQLLNTEQKGLEVTL